MKKREVVQLNLRVKPSTKKKVERMAHKEDLTMGRLIDKLVAEAK